MRILDPHEYSFVSGGDSEPVIDLPTDGGSLPPLDDGKNKGNNGFGNGGGDGVPGRSGFQDVTR